MVDKVCSPWWNAAGDRGDGGTIIIGEHDHVDVDIDVVASAGSGWCWRVTDHRVAAVTAHAVSSGPSHCAVLCYVVVVCWCSRESDREVGEVMECLVR